MKLRKIFFLLMTGIFSIQIFSQKIPDCTKKIYVAPDGKMYVNKALPIYLRISNQPGDKANSVLLKSENSSRNTIPFYFDVEGYNSIRSPWCIDTTTKQLVYPKKDIKFEVYADSKPPVTAINFGDSKILRQKGKLYLNAKTEIKLSAADELSGVDKIMYSLDSSEFKEYQETISLENEKEYILKYYSFDKVGNIEPLKTLDIVIDKSSPRTMLEIKGDVYENILSGKTMLTLKAVDSISGLESITTKLDDGPEGNYSGPIYTALIMQGEHKLVYWSTDNVKNKEQEHTYNFYVDKTPPTIIQEVVGKSFMLNGKEFSSGKTQLKLTAIDNKAGVKDIFYSINNGEYKKYSAPVTLSTIGGNLSIKSYALDRVNNRSQATEEEQAVKVPYIDLSGPVLSFALQGPVFKTSDTIYISSKTKILLKGYDNESGMNNIQYNVDGGELKAFNAAFSIDQEGYHKIEYIGTDNVENTTNGTITFMVDNTGPSIFERFSTLPKGTISEQGKTIILYPGHVGLFISATDTESGYDRMTYSINGSIEKPFTGFLSGFDKTNVVIIKAYDKLGNESKAQIEFGIKN
jgi:hypothetical protein